MEGLPAVNVCGITVSLGVRDLLLSLLDNQDKVGLSKGTEYFVGWQGNYIRIFCVKTFLQPPTHSLLPITHLLSSCSMISGAAC